jgi:hypothetical protein
VVRYGALSFSELEHRRKGLTPCYITANSVALKPIPPSHRCRNPRCGARLKPPVETSRRAFCCSGCYAAFFQNRCRVCEADLPPGPANRQICWRQRCRQQVRKFPHLYQYAKTVKRPLRSAHFTGLKIGTKTGRPSRQIAGPELTPTSLRLASLPIDLDLATRLERVHRPFVEALKRSKRRAARKAQLKRHHPPVNIGGYRFPSTPELDLSPLPEPEWAAPSRWAPTAMPAVCPPIPGFLLRHKAGDTCGGGGSCDLPDPAPSRKPQSNSFIGAPPSIRERPGEPARKRYRSKNRHVEESG